MSLFNKIRSGEITKAGLESSLAKFEADKIDLASKRKHFGPELFAKQIAEINFGIELLKGVIDRYDDLRMPMKREKGGSK